MRCSKFLTKPSGGSSSGSKGVTKFLSLFDEPKSEALSGGDSKIISSCEKIKRDRQWADIHPNRYIWQGQNDRVKFKYMACVFVTNA